MGKPVQCPHCGRRLMDSEDSVITQTKISGPFDTGPPDNRWKPDYYIKCWKCHSRVGFRKIEKL